MSESKECKDNQAEKTGDLASSSVVIIERSPTVEEYRALRDAVGWGNGDATAQAQGLANSLFSVCIIHENKVVGCGRVVGDNGLYFYIQDVILHPLYQGRGLGRRIMASIMGYITSNARPGAFIGLMAAEDKAPFYYQYGFKERPTDRPGMEIWVQ
jgi:GNAT superfamily N-acetyltransferase